MYPSTNKLTFYLNVLEICSSVGTVNFTVHQQACKYLQLWKFIRNFGSSIRTNYFDIRWTV